MAPRTLPFVAISAILISCSVYQASLVGGAIGAAGMSSGAGNSNSNGGTGEDPPSAGTGPLGNGGRPGVMVAGRAGESSAGADPGGGGAGGNDTGGMGGDGDPGGGAGEAGAGGDGGDGGSTVDTGGVGGAITGGSGGTGGSAGLGGGGTSSGGDGGMGGMGGTGGVGGAGGNGGAGGSPTFTGCAVLTTALDAAADKAHFLITLAADTDFTGATVSVHAHVEGALGGNVYLYLQQSTFEYWGGAATDLTDLSGWETLDWVIGTTTGVDKTLIRRLGIEINGEGATAWSNPTVVNIDSITVTTASLSFTFDTTATVFATPAADRTADRAMWLNNGSSDTTALAGSSIAWSATCP